MDENDLTVDPGWYRHAFEALYPLVYAHRTVEAAAAEAAFAIRELALESSEAVLDLACGNGRHLAHLRRQTTGAVGLDYSPVLLARARETAGLSARLVRGDMRAVPFAGVFDAVTSFFTSFGYFLSEGENQQTVSSVAQALRVGGRLFIDYLNPPHLEANLAAHSSRRAGDYEIAEHRWIDSKTRRINKVTVISKDGLTVDKLEESVRLYTRHELETLMDAAGLLVDRAYGNFDGRPYSETSPRMILIGHRAR